MLHGPCYHRVCYNCLVGRALLPIRRLRSETGRSEANLKAELRRVTEAGLLSCHKCRATIAWPWGFLGPYSKRQGHGSAPSPATDLASWRRRCSLSAQPLGACTAAATPSSPPNPHFLASRQDLAGGASRDIL